MSEDLLGKWAVNLMLINVSTRRFGRAVRLPEGDVPAAKGTGVSKSAVSRRFVALSAQRMTEWMAADLSELDLLIIQIDAIHIEEDLTLLAAVALAHPAAQPVLQIVDQQIRRQLVPPLQLATGELAEMTAGALRRQHVG